ncbi:MAG: hypothetical protein ACR2L9_13950 [Solirubrobacteraceae bacterium]
MIDLDRYRSKIDHTELVGENFAAVRRALSLSDEALMTLARNSFEALFLDDETRGRYLAELEACLAQLRRCRSTSEGIALCRSGRQGDGAFRVGRLSRLRPTRDELHCLRNVDQMSLNAPGS